MFFESSWPRSRVRCSLRPKPTKHCKNCIGKHIGAFARQDKNDQKSASERSRLRSSLRTRSKRVWGRLRTPFGSPWAANLPSKTANMAAKTANLAAKTAKVASQSRSERVLERPHNEADRPKPPKTDPTSIFEGSWVDFSWIFGRCWDDFRFIFVRLCSPSAVVRTHLQCVPRTALIAQDANNNCLPDSTDAPRVDAPRVSTACSHTACSHTIPPSFEIFQNISKCFEIFRNVSKYFEMFRNISK